MIKKIAVLVTAVAVLVWTIPDASALRITLKRIVFEGPKRAESITIINPADEEVTYRIGWRHFAMTEDKALEPVRSGEPLPPGIKPVTDMVRFAPRRFTVPPRSSQQIRLMFRAPKGLEDGEYRSHLWVRPEANIADLKKSDGQSGSSGGGVSLTMLTGVTMPVIVRKGNLQASVQFDEISARRNGNNIDLGFALVREGTKSLYGDVVYTCNDGLNGYELRKNRGVAMYTESSRRRFNVSAEQPADVAACREIRLRFVETDGFSGKELGVLAESVVAVQ